MGLPSTWDEKWKLLSYESYINNSFIIRESEENFKGMADNLRGRTIVDLLIDDFCLLWKIKKKIFKSSNI
jgi:hypothetical protein